MKALLVIDMLEDFIDSEGALTTGPAGEEIVDFIQEKKFMNSEKRIIQLFIFVIIMK